MKILYSGKKAELAFKKAISLFPVAIAQIMYTEAIKLLVPAVKAKVRENKSVFRGDLHQRIGVKVAVSDKGPAIDLGAIGVPYSLGVEKGTDPHTPDKELIEEYVRRKMKKKGPAAVGIVAAIVSTLEKRGAKAHPFITPAWKANKVAYSAIVINRVKMLWSK